MVVRVHAPAKPQVIDPDLLLLAYRSGVFPMADSRDDPDIFWVEPRRRAIFPLDSFHPSRSLGRTLRRERFTVTCNRAFTDVIAACAAPRESESGESWISHRIAASYCELHRLGHAHSIECWREGVLVGGLYGVGFDAVFCGESMFSRVSDASKVALCWLVAALRRAGVVLLDCQFMTEHLRSLGAVEISQQRYVRLLSAAQRHSAASSRPPGEGLGAGRLAGAAEAAAGAKACAPMPLPEAFALLLAEAAGASSSPGNFIAQSLTQTS